MVYIRSSYTYQKNKYTTYMSRRVHGVHFVLFQRQVYYTFIKIFFCDFFIIIWNAQSKIKVSHKRLLDLDVKTEDNVQYEGENDGGGAANKTVNHVNVNISVCKKR